MCMDHILISGVNVNLFDFQGVSDGAAAVVIASEDALKEHKLTPLARIVAYHASGCDPSIMGIGGWCHDMEMWCNPFWRLKNE